MPISDYEMIAAWKQVLTLSKLQAGQTVTILTSASTHPQTLSSALIATQSMGAIVNRLDLLPVNGEKALSRDSLAYLGTTPLTGNLAAIAARPGNGEGLRSIHYVGCAAIRPDERRRNGEGR